MTPQTTTAHRMRSCETPLRFFQQALPRRSSQHVWSAWVTTNTISSNATRPYRETRNTPQSQSKMRIETCSSRKETPPYALTGNTPMDVPPQGMTAGMSVLGATHQLTELMSALEHRRHEALIPYHPDAWEHHLKAAGLAHTYAHIIQGLQFGFKADFPLITITQTPPNQDSIVAYSKPYLDILHNKLKTG